MLGTREYTLCSPFRANAHNSSCQLLLSFVRCAFELLQKGADPNLVLADGATPFHLVVGLQDEILSSHFTRLLLQFGADPNGGITL